MARLHRKERFNQSGPIAKIDTRPMAILAVCLLAVTAVMQRPQVHAFHINLWDGANSNPLSLQTSGALFATEAPLNRVTLSHDDIISWNGEVIYSSQLLELLRVVQESYPTLVLEFEPDGNASYDATAKLLLILHNSGTTFRIAGTEKYCAFGYAAPTRYNSKQKTTIQAPPNLPYNGERWQPGPDNKSCEPQPIIHAPTQSR